MIFFVFACSSGVDSKPDSARSDLGSDTDADTDTDADADTDADTDTDTDTALESGTTGPSSETGDSSGSSDCGDPSISYSSLAVPISGEFLDTTHSYDLCLGSSVSGWLSFSAWDGGQLAYQVGWEVSSSSSPSSIPVPAYFTTDISWHLEFSGEQLLAGDPAPFGVPFEAGSLTNPLDVALDEDGGEVYFYSSSWEVWYRLDPYDGLVAVPMGLSWDLDYDVDGPQVIVP